ncbi:unnamed protein product [Phytophthora lilii]|uniref:Unnamed protein product n=1 Tax=Phytophthora lilii TaxID=2077276 RepID=A0A9W6TBI4_9STRA|nr:unnamed protein product [Phytophthora lilii]
MLLVSVGDCVLPSYSSALFLFLKEEQSGNVTPRTSPGKLASLLSIIKQKKEEQVHSGDQQQPRSQDTYDRRQRDDAGAYNHRSYGERRNDDQRYDRRDVGGIMGDAPGVPVGSGRIRRAPDDREDERDPKKARGSRWGPPKLDNPPSNDRPSPIITSLDREGDYRSDSGRPGYRSPVSSRQAPLLQSPRGDQPRHEEWNRNAPSSRGSGAGWPREGVRSPQTGGRHNANPYEQGGSQRSPFAESDDRRSPGNRIPGTSGELCRNFLAGRCTFGDRCCFAHGEDELDKSARQPSRAPAHGDQNGGRWQPSPNSRPGLEQAPQSRISPSANAPAPPQARSYGAAQVYNEPHGDRGSRGGDSSVSYANAAAPSPGGRRLPPDHQPAATASTQGYPGAYDTTGSSYTNQGSSFSSTADQGRSRVPGGTLVLPSPGSGGQSLGDRTAAAPTSAKVLEDEDDDGDTIEPEFTLQYDDDD